ncbi:hypothetical protein Nepgr_028394 [Nepenthes gracilis]|uniref:Leucine-rich repeat-containing N-terminal plant-type domain-containing protein n=1 Tax=Nepenthes gracilis TaxID=150966 RepID=A0AAD3Y4H3_NEPGR|nr:hypothetical protein Nepgr_028394 [Nepenthes gracilis]
MMVAVMIMVVYCQIDGGGGCWEEERTALLQLKVSINYPAGSLLLSWKEDKHSNCCRWEGVSCDSQGRVTSLSLDNLRREEPLGDWHLNASLFLPLHQLRELSLQFNSMVSWREDKACESLASKLTHLEVLDISFNKLDNSALPPVSTLASIRKLDLSGNFLEGFINFHDIEALENLDELHLNINYISGFTGRKNSNRVSTSLKKLKFIDLTYNNLNNDILLHLNKIPSLQHLILAQNQLTGSIHGRDIEHLENLEELDLSHNTIDSFITSSASSSSRLKNLKVLDLSYNNFTSNILSSLGAFSSVRQLYLTNNNMTGSVHLSDIEALQNLVELDLSNTDIYRFRTTNRPYNLLHIERLYMDDCFLLNRNLLQGLGVMTSLKVLTLYNAKLSGELTSYGWLCELRNLQVLDLSDNGFNGTLPPCLLNITSLRILDLWRNQLSENITTSPLVRLTSLEYLSLSYNNFQIPHSFSPFANHSNLKIVLGDSNVIIREFELQPIIPRFQLQILSLSNCMLYGEPPSFLFYQHDLRVADLSNSNLQGNFPAWLFDNNTRLQGLHLRQSLLTGPFQFPVHPHLSIATIDVSHNEMVGKIPVNFNVTFPNLKRLDVSNNAFERKSPPCFRDMNSLQTLNLSNNHLSGKLPQNFVAGSPIQFLDISNNDLEGPISWVSNLTHLDSLYLQGNNFSGKIPVNLSTNLQTMDLSSNHFSGELPRWMNVSNFKEINMSQNHLEGRIPEEYCELYNLDFLDLSENNLTGIIPPCFPPFIKYVHLSKNRLSGPFPYAFRSNTDLLVLDLSYNNLTGRLPNWIGDLGTLSILLLGSNHFEGNIPTGLCNLNQLSILDLSKNNLYGPIPRCLNNITFQPSDAKAYDGSSFTLSEQPLYEKTKGKMPYLDDTNYSMIYNDLFLSIQERVEFTTKSMAYSYEGKVLVYMSGIDLSCNKLTGEIPPDMGSLSEIRALNLSHNNLLGSIPATFSNLGQIESLDLSYNFLNGSIPPELTQLTYLEAFSVAHNNLSGKTLGLKDQFGTFGEASYEGNPFLCGPPLPKNCTDAGSPSLIPISEEDNQEDNDDDWIDMGTFYVSFVVSYIIMFLGIVIVLVINPNWRRRWFCLVDNIVISSYCFVVVNFRKLKKG